MDAIFPYLTRIFWLAAQPLSLILLLVVLGLGLSFARRRWPARLATGLALLLVVLCAYSSFGYWLVAPLEARFARPAEPAHIEGIVVLGGGTDSGVNSVRHGWELNRSGDRMVEAVRLALRHPEAKVLLAGGNGALATNQEPEALASRRMLVAFGVDPGRILIDDKSRNTEENAQFAKALAGDTSGQTWLLVTSAFHMPRSMGLFRAAGFEVLAWPADYLGSGAEGFGLKFDEAPENLAVTSIAMREWLGLVGYRLTGRIAEVLPGP